MRLVIFDLDGTLLTGDTDEYWLRFLIERGIVDHGEIERRGQDLQDRYARGLASAEEFCFFYLSLLRGHARADLDRLHAEFMRSVIIPHLPAAALDLLGAARARADLLLMSTATSTFLTAPIAAHLGFAHLIATVPEEGADGGFTGGCVGPPNMHAHKVTRLEAWLAARGQRLEDFAQTWFYSDSRNDLPLLSRVSHPVAVDPDPELAARATAGGWPVLHVHPSKLRRNRKGDGMAFDPGLAERVRDALREQQDICERKMFGGLAFMSRGHMFVGILGDTLMARVGPDEYAAALAQPGARQMDFTGKPMKGYVFVAPEAIETDPGLERWIARCLAFAGSLPAK